MNTPHLALSFSHQMIDVTDAGQTLQRSFLIHVPLKSPKVAMPAVLVFHGGGQNASDMVQHWASMLGGDFVIVCPQALIDPTINKTLWAQARPGDTVIPTTDLAFVDALLRWLAASGDVDIDRVYATGFSSGAGMTWQLSMHDEFVNRFKGFAPVAKGVSSAQQALAHPMAANTPKPLIYIHGTADDNWAQLYDNVPEPMPPDVVITWMRRNRSLPASTPVVYSCATERPLDPVAVEQLYLPDPAVAGSRAVCFLTIINGGHCWPLTGHDPSGRGLVCRDFDATKRIIGFWNTHAGMGLLATPDWRVC